MLETVLALITPYAAFVLGDVQHVSPVMAVIVAELAIGARQGRITTAQTRLQLHSVYQTVISLLESVVFSLIGLQLPTLIRALSRTEAWPAEALTVTGTLIVIRILWVLPLSAIIQRRGGARRPSWPVPAVVIVISLIVQGLTLEPLVRRAGVARPAGRHEETVARLRLAEAALARLDELAAGECAADDVIDRARASLQARLGRTRARIDGTRAPEPDGLTDRELRRDLNAAENAELARLTTTAPSARPPASSCSAAWIWRPPGSASHADATRPLPLSSASGRCGARRFAVSRPPDPRTRACVS